MERKLVKQGANTLFVSLPSTWIKNNNLLKGSVVNLNIKNNKIIVSSLFNNSNNIKEYSDKITNFDRIYLKSFFDNLNKIGYDIINLNINDKKSIPIFEKILNEYFMNLEIIGYENKILKISNIATNNLLIIENLLTKIIYIIENLLKMLKSNIDLNEIDRYNKQIFKLKSYMQRVLLKQEKSSVSFQFVFLTRLNQLSTTIVKIANEINNTKIQPNSILIDEIIIYYRLFKVNFLSKNLKNKEEIISSYDDFFNNKLTKYMNKKESKIYFNLFYLIRMIYLTNFSLEGIIYLNDEK